MNPEEIKKRDINEIVNKRVQDEEYDRICAKEMKRRAGYYTYVFNRIASPFPYMKVLLDNKVEEEETRVLLNNTSCKEQLLTILFAALMEWDIQNNNDMIKSCMEELLTCVPANPISSEL